MENAQILVMDFMIIGEYTNDYERVIIKARKEYFVSIKIYSE